MNDFDTTTKLLENIQNIMSHIHWKYEDKNIREKALEPYRKICIILHHERIRLNASRNQ